MLFNYVTVIPKCINQNCIDLYLELKKTPSSPALVGYDDHQNTNLSSRKTNWIPLPDSIRELTTQAIKNLYETQLISTYKQPIKNIEPPQFLHYDYQGKYDLHNDSEDYINNKLQRVCERDVSVLIYLNDDYSGGELEFPDWGVTFKPKAGTLIAFPSYIEFSHRVHPVIQGNRYNLVSWICTYDRIYSRPYL